MTTIAPYGTWQSPITAELVTAAHVGLGQPALDRGVVYWTEARPQEGGRVALVRQGPGGRADVMPAGFNVRTRVHEYGGGGWLVRDGVVVAVDFADQRLYRLEEGAPPRALTPESDRRLRYADLEPDLGRRRILAVREDHRGGGEAVNSIVAVGLDGEDAGRVLAEGHDFFSSPRLSPDGRRLAWLSWDHPDMPWDGTSSGLPKLATTARFATGPPGRRRRARIDLPARVVAGRRSSISCPTAAAGGTSTARPTTAAALSARWLPIRRAGLGLRQPLVRLPRSGDDRSPASARTARWHLARLDVAAGRLTPARSALQLVRRHRASMAAGRCCAPAGPTGRRRSSQLDPASGACDGALHRGRRAGRCRLSLAHPEPISVPQAAALRRTPSTIRRPIRTSAAPAGERPPLIVMSHGGPTGATRASCASPSSSGPGAASRVRRQLRRQHRLRPRLPRAAERPLGRRRRRRLRERGALSGGGGKADDDRLAITGGSAGGYTTLAR